MKPKYGVALVACLLCAIALTACSGATGAQSQAAGESSRQSDMSMEVSDISMQDSDSSSQAGPALDPQSIEGFWAIEPDSSLGLEATLNIEDGGFAELVIGDAYAQGTWTIDGSQATIDFLDKFGTEIAPELDGRTGAGGLFGTASIYPKGEKLIMGREDGSRLVFVKTDIVDYYANDPEDDSILLKAEPSEAEEVVDVVEESIEDIAPVSIADDKVCKIDVIGKGTDFIGDPCYKLSITNKSSKTISLAPQGMFMANGCEAEAEFGEYVDPKCTIEAIMAFSAQTLGGGAETLNNVSGTIVVRDDLTSDKLKKYAFEVE